MTYLLRISVKVQIRHYFPWGDTANDTSETKHLPCKHPPQQTNGMHTLVVAGDSNINPVERGVRVAKGNDGDVHVGGLSEGLVVKAGIANNDESWLQVPIIKYKLEFFEQTLIEN